METQTMYCNSAVFFKYNIAAYVTNLTRMLYIFIKKLHYSILYIILPYNSYILFIIDCM